MAEETIYLLPGNMLPVYERHIPVFFRPVYMTKKALLLRDPSIPYLDRHMAPLTGVAVSDCFQMIEEHPAVSHGPLKLTVAYSAPPLLVHGLLHIQMTEEADVHRNLHMFSLHDI